MPLRSMACITVMILLGCSGQKTEDPSDSTMAVNPDAEELQIMVPAGHPLLVQLRGELSTKRNAAGDTFTGILLQPVMIEGREVVPSGSLIMGRVDYLDPPADDQPATMTLSIVEVGGDPAHTNLLKLEASTSTGEEGPAGEAGAGLGTLGAGRDAAGAAVGTGTGAVIAVVAHERHIRLRDGQKMRFEFTRPYVISRKTA